MSKSENIPQEKYVLTITAENVVSTDPRFTMDNLSLGDNYRPLDAYYEKGDGDIIRRNYVRGERKNTNQTLPRIACQVFEKQLSTLPVEDKENFPICKYNPNSSMIRGIFRSVDEFKKSRNTIEYLTYGYDEGRQFVIYCWNIFTTIIFVKECLKRFGEAGDKFVLIYRDKDRDKEGGAPPLPPLPPPDEIRYLNPFSSILIESKNLIFRGAPGTGKSYLAKEIAADIISNGYFDDCNSLSDDQKKQVEFVQFHPSYDYSDFVEGLRPKLNEDGTMGFELKDGIFKRFANRAKKNYEDSRKSKETIEKEITAQETLTDFLSNIEFGVDTFKTVSGNEFTITGVDDSHINISIPGNSAVNKLALSMDDMRKMLESGHEFEKVRDITEFFGKTFSTQAYSYNFAIYKAIKEKKNIATKTNVKPEELKKYIFIIDEINRGNLSKIFGELFMLIENDKRDIELPLLYSEEKFAVPSNVYLIGTMNTADRSLAMLDYALRRRFSFYEMSPSFEMKGFLDYKTELNNKKFDHLIKCVKELNEDIMSDDSLGEGFYIGHSYFCNLDKNDVDNILDEIVSFELLPLLKEYWFDEPEKINKWTIRLMDAIK